MKINPIHFGLRVAACLAFVLFFLPAGCGLNTAGHMACDQGLVKQYQEKLLPEQFNYFYCGRQNLPYAVVGIDPAYTFENFFWFFIESKQDLYSKIDHLSDLAPGQNRMYARSIIGPAGNTVGVWFSFYSSTGVMVDDDNHSIQVFNPYNPESMLNSF